MGFLSADAPRTPPSYTSSIVICAALTTAILEARDLFSKVVLHVMSPLRFPFGPVQVYLPIRAGFSVSKLKKEEVSWAMRELAWVSQRELCLFISQAGKLDLSNATMRGYDSTELSNCEFCEAFHC